MTSGPVELGRCPRLVLAPVAPVRQDPTTSDAFLTWPDSASPQPSPLSPSVETTASLVEAEDANATCSKPASPHSRPLLTPMPAPRSSRPTGTWRSSTPTTLAPRSTGSNQQQRELLAQQPGPLLSSPPHLTLSRLSFSKKTPSSNVGASRSMICPSPATAISLTHETCCAGPTDTRGTQRPEPPCSRSSSAPPSATSPPPAPAPSYSPKNFGRLGVTSPRGALMTSTTPARRGSRALRPR